MLNLLTIATTVKKIKVACDGLFTLASLIAVPAMVGTVIYWVAEPGTSASVKSSDRQSISATRGETTTIKPKVSMVVANKVVSYTVRLIDSKGEIAYEYPTTKVDADFDPEDKGAVMLKVPPNIPKGSYDLVVDMEYPKNPLKSNKLQIEMAHLNVE